MLHISRDPGLEHYSFFSWKLMEASMEAWKLPRKRWKLLWKPWKLPWKLPRFHGSDGNFRRSVGASIETFALPSPWKLPRKFPVEASVEVSMKISKVMFCRVCGFRVRVWESYKTSRSFGYGYGCVTELTEVPGGYKKCCTRTPGIVARGVQSLQIFRVRV